MSTMPATSEASAKHKQTAIARRQRDGGVLLSISDDRICRLNGVAALTWMVIEKSRQELTIEEIAQRLHKWFDVINREGELFYDVSIEQLRQDIARLVADMTRMNLLRATSDLAGRSVHCISSGVNATTTSRDADDPEDGAQRHVQAGSCRLPGSVSARTAKSSLTAGSDLSKAINIRYGEVFIAFIGLAVFDLVLKIRGLESLLKRVESWPTAATRARESGTCERVRATVDRAQIYYPKKAMCLQHSAVVTCFLRRLGVRAELVLAAQEFPPKGHAWTEAEGEVINDSPTVKEKYRELKRI